MVNRRAGYLSSPAAEMSFPVVFDDKFNEAADTHLTVHQSDIGAGWLASQNFDSGSSHYLIKAIAGTGYAQASINTANNLIYAFGGTRLISPDCEFEITLTKVPIVTTYNVGIFARFVDQNNFYYVDILGDAAGTYGRTIDLCKVVASTRTVLGTYAITWVLPAIIRFKLVGNNLTVTYNGATIISATDSDFTLTGGWGLALGRMVATPAYGFHTTWWIDRFRVAEYNGVPDATHKYPVIFYDTFFDTAGTALTAHTPNLGTSWAIASNPGSLSITTTGTEATCGAATNQKAVVIASPAPAVADVELSVLMGAGALTYSNVCQVLIARYQDMSNFYCAVIYQSTNTEDCQIWKVVSGVATKLGGVDAATTNLQITYSLRIVGDSIKLFRLFKEILSVTDSALPNAGSCGLGWGAVVVGTDRINAASYSAIAIREIRSV